MAIRADRAPISGLRGRAVLAAVGRRRRRPRSPDRPGWSVRHRFSGDRSRGVGHRSTGLAVGTLLSPPTQLFLDRIRALERIGFVGARRTRVPTMPWLAHCARPLSIGHVVPLRSVTHGLATGSAHACIRAVSRRGAHRGHSHTWRHLSVQTYARTPPSRPPLHVCRPSRPKSYRYLTAASHAHRGGDLLRTPSVVVQPATKALASQLSARTIGHFSTNGQDT